MHSSERFDGIRTTTSGSARVQALVAAFFALGVLVAAAEQVSEAGSGRFGSVGRSLSEREVGQIAALATAAGKPVWLVLGLHSMIRGVATLTVYLQPNVSTERLHRGRILRLVAKDPPVVAERSGWIVKDTASYAYVPLGEPADEIASKDDLAWPFTIEGELDDETLISLVTYVRSRPSIPGVPEGQAPLSVIARRGDEFIAAFRTGDAAVFRVWLIRKDGKWQVTKWDAAIV